MREHQHDHGVSPSSRSKIHHLWMPSWFESTSSMAKSRPSPQATGMMRARPSTGARRSKGRFRDEVGEDWEDSGVFLGALSLTRTIAFCWHCFFLGLRFLTHASSIPWHLQEPRRVPAALRHTALTFFRVEAPLVKPGMSICLFNFMEARRLINFFVLGKARQSPYWWLHDGFQQSERLYVVFDSPPCSFDLSN